MRLILRRCAHTDPTGGFHAIAFGAYVGLAACGLKGLRGKRGKGGGWG